MRNHPCPTCANFRPAFGVWEDEERATETSLHISIKLQIRCMHELIPDGDFCYKYEPRQLSFMEDLIRGS